MRIEITRSGGFAGIQRTWSLEVSSNEAEQRWLPLAEAEAAERGPLAGPDQRDRFSYRILVGYVEVWFPESRLEDPWRELITRARTAAEQARTTSENAPGPAEEQAPRNPPELL